MLPNQAVWSWTTSLFFFITLLHGTSAAYQEPLQLTSPHHISSTSFTTFISPLYPRHQIRIKRQNETLCAAGSEQFTGWLDVGRRHFFFWFFRSQSQSPDTSPLILWLTGGPGGSSMLGLLQELGPCLINEHGNGTVHNEFGWTKRSNVIFLDQPAGVGLSYVDKGDPVAGDSFEAAEDMTAFLQLFVSEAFPEMQSVPFHISGESYAGHYVPALATRILRQNTLYPNEPHINLKSVLIGNGYFSPADTTFGYWSTLCTTNPGVKKPVFNSTRCDIMASNLPRCMELATVCYKHPDPAICQAANDVCWHGVVEWYDGESGRNRFDITEPCTIDFCYPRTAWIQQFFEQDWVLDALAVPKEQGRKFRLFSPKVAVAFGAGVDLFISMTPQIQTLLASGIDVLIYQGKLDLACNTAGNVRWAESLSWKGQAEFVAKTFTRWTLSSSGKDVGEFKEVFIAVDGVNDKATNVRFTLLTIDNSGHLVPQDQPEPALDMMVKWIERRSLA